VGMPRLTREVVHAAMRTTALATTRHPIRDWLTGLMWDGALRLDGWLARAFGCLDDGYHRKVGAAFLTAAVRRVMRPGCQFDYMPILEGPQGIGKSRACRVLFGDDWFTDNIPLNLGSKDASEAMRGVWGVEWSEIEHLIRVEPGTVKAFVSRRVDRYRPPFGRNTQEFPRHCVVIGTTNEDEYLRDDTGNRRFWPVRCIRADVEWIERERGQLWAEAVVREAIGEPLWLGEGLEATAGDAQAERMIVDAAWASVIELHIEGRTVVTMFDVLHMGIGIPKGQIGRREEMRAGKILRSLGWRKGFWDEVVDKISKATKTRRGWKCKDYDTIMAERKAEEAAKQLESNVVTLPFAHREKV
jgi:predicted P-loop ATPase